MKANFYIDGLDMYTRYGVWIAKGGYNNLLTFPSMKEPSRNDWPEEDGVEVDLSNPVFTSKEITIPFIASKPGVDVSEFIQFISTPGYHTLYVPSLFRTWEIRLTTHPSNNIYKGVTEFSLRFTEDVVVRRSESPNPGLPVLKSAYEIDSIPFEKFGIIVESGKESLLKAPTVKRNLLRSIKTEDGQIYDADHLVFSAKEVTFKCRLKAISMNHFWQCYDAFFSTLTQPEERLLYVDYTGEEYPCYYRKTGAFKILNLSSMVMVSFDLTLVFTSFRINGIEHILATEDGDWIVLEEDGETAIDMNYGN